tara:strand:- start:596 stop:841 length:246 start_codon:yes stop_codon:yes gene_type:complete
LPLKGTVTIKFNADKQIKIEAKRGKKTGSRATSVVPGIVNAQPLTRLGEYKKSNTPVMNTIIANADSILRPLDIGENTIPN